MPMSPEEVAQLLHGVGFRGEDLVSMVAIAGRESGYRPEAHRTNTDPEKMVGDFGLFQINYINDTPAFRQAIGLTDRSQLLDPEMNAKAAHYLYERAGLKPWTAGPGGWRPDGDPTYGTDVEAARAAVQRAEQSGLITQPFDDPSTLAPPALPDPPDADSGNDLDTPLERFLKMAVAQAGDPYDSDSNADITDNPNPWELECSELTEWAGIQAGIKLDTTSYLQFFQMQDANAIVSVQDALDTPGALLFTFDPPPVRGGGRPPKAHVAISLGDGRTIEAMSTKHGIKIADENPGRWTNAAIIPEFAGQRVDMADVMTWVGRDDDAATMLYGTPMDPTPYDDGAPGLPSLPQAPPPPAPPPPDPKAEAIAAAKANEGGVDSDSDMLPDHFETKYALDPADPDTDGDGITDGYELIVLGTDADLADSDFDGIGDGLELSYGLDPTKADNPDLNQPLEAPDDLTFDSDGDGISDWGEELAGTDVRNPDTDGDGSLDGDELMDRTDPLATT